MKEFDKVCGFDSERSFSDDKVMEEENSTEEDSSILTTVRTSSKNLKAYSYKHSPYVPAKSFARCSFVAKDWDPWIKSLLLALHLSYSLCNLSGYFVQDDGWSWSPTFVTLNHDAYGVPSPSLGFLPDFLNLQSSSNGLCQSFNDSGSLKELRELPQPNNYQGFEPAIVLAFEPSMLNMSANYQLICEVPWFGQQVACFKFTGMKGMAYWQSTSKQAVAFDMINESYEIISTPPKTPQGGVFSEMHEYDSYWLKIYCGVNLELKACSINLLLKFVNQRYIQSFQVLMFLVGSSHILVQLDGFVMFLMGSWIPISLYSLIDGSKF